MYNRPITLAHVVHREEKKDTNSAPAPWRLECVQTKLINDGVVIVSQHLQRATQTPLTKMLFRHWFERQQNAYRRRAGPIWKNPESILNYPLPFMQRHPVDCYELFMAATKTSCGTFMLQSPLHVLLVSQSDDNERYVQYCRVMRQAFVALYTRKQKSTDESLADINPVHMIFDIEEEEKEEEKEDEEEDEDDEHEEDDEEEQQQGLFVVLLCLLRLLCKSVCYVCLSVCYVCLSVCLANFVFIVFLCSPVLYVATSETFKGKMLVISFILIRIYLYDAFVCVSSSY
jgi:hypothetical protein